MCGYALHILWSDRSISRSGSTLSHSFDNIFRKRRASMKVTLSNCWLQGLGCNSYTKKAFIKRLNPVCCKTQPSDHSLSGIADKDQNGNSLNPLIMTGVVKGPNAQLQEKKEVLTPKVRPPIDSLEEEAWDLLRQSMVYYCGSPIGTIAANDSNCSDVLNYDQVFIRDFIPSGIAFLLKGEYDIVRNFILHTLQLQVF